ncbi:MAG TPA: pyridoxamine 5'-phosphate oxidase family protein [Chloroflexota bacterium]|jgi:nitroimidazol reductase NimA-like FMN-containing flavoprotein (pyridoxamine 5'-phosphate oxidase superfamily)|nr:pyridoxamine 5'-phosphate oxidase family protein [Chloroflexota bacterium]
MTERGREAEPVASRPRSPGADYGVPQTTEGLLPWSHARERLEQAQNYWLCTVRRDGRPHAVPLWGLWVDDTFYVGAGGQKGRNLEANPAVVVHLESGSDVVIVEGVAEVMTAPDPSLEARLAKAYEVKYGMHPGSLAGTYAVRPRVVHAWKEMHTATRWRFARG